MNKNSPLFWQIALWGPALFFSSGFSEDELASRFATPTQGTARDFFVLRTLAEVQKYGAAARRWEVEEKHPSSGDHFDTLVKESLIVERVAWERRLLEALVTFINFSTTNQNEYYAHFLAVREFERKRHHTIEERDFFGVESELTKRKLNAMQSLVDAARARLPVSANCWYLKSNDSHKPTTLRTQYLHAMKFARSGEKTALGYTYQMSFGDTSEQLHFGVLECPTESESGVRATYALCGELAIAIICRAHDLCGIEPRGINKSLMQSANRDRPISKLLSARADVGDFVLTAGTHLAEVLEIRKADFDYESYRVEFLDLENGPGLNEDWLPAPAIMLFMNRKDMIRDVRARLTNQTENRINFSEGEIRECTKEAVLEMWKRGVRKYFLRQIDMPKSQDT